MSDSNPADQSSRPANMASEIDRLIGSTLPGSVRVNTDGTSEALPVPQNAMSRSGDVAAPPSLDDLTSQLDLHGRRIAQFNDELNAQVFNRNTGAPEGHRVTGKDREQMIAHRDRALNEQAYIIQLMETTSAARIAWNQAREAERAGATPAEPSAEDVAAREAAIRELSDMPGSDGKPIGRVAALREYNAAQLRERADRLVRR
jgi:hypothetical protein